MALSMAMVLLMVVMVVMVVAASLSREDHGSHAAHGLGLCLGQQGRRGLGSGFAGLRHARRDKPRDERRGEGRSAPAAHAGEVPHLAEVRRFGARVLPGRVRVDQPLARREDVHPRPVVAEPGSAAPVRATARPRPPPRGRPPARTSVVTNRSPRPRPARHRGSSAVAGLRRRNPARRCPCGY